MSKPGRTQPAARNLFLTGFMGAGKSTIGPLIARKTGWKFIDTDRLIVRKAGMSIPAIFAKKGEPYFRRLESQVLRQVCRGSRQIVSLGGGILMRAENRARIRQSGKLVYLQASATTLLKRTRGPKSKRPLLASPSEGARLARIRSLLRDRRKFYESSHFSIRTDSLSPQAAAVRIIHQTLGVSR